MDIEHCFTVRLDRIYQIRVAADKALTQRLLNMSVARLPPIRTSERTTVQKYKKNQIANRQFRTIYLYRHKKVETRWTASLQCFIENRNGLLFHCAIFVNDGFYIGGGQTAVNLVANHSNRSQTASANATEGVQ